MRVIWVSLLLAFGICGCEGKTSSGTSGGASDKPSGDIQKSDGQKPDLAFVTNAVASFWTIAKAGALAAGRDFNADVDIRMPDGVADQNRILEDLLTRGAKGIAISPIDSTNQIEKINAACDRTILITHDSDAPDTKRLCYVGMDNYLAGRLCGQLVKEVLPDGGEIVILVGRLEQDNAKRRRQGVIDELMDRPADPNRYDEPGKPVRGEKFTVLDTRTDQFDRSRAKQNAEDMMVTYPELDCMVGLFAYNIPAIIEALKGGDKLNEIKIVAFDEHDATLLGIREGYVHGTVVQDPYKYGYESIRILAGLTRGEKVLPDGGFLDIPARQIRKDNVDAFETELKANLAAGKGG